MLRALVVAVGLVIGGGLAQAAPPVSPVTAEAQRLYAQGTKLYNLSMWKAALEEFQKAYLLRPQPELLFNIGQCQRQLGDAQGAANSYRAYLRESKSLSTAQRDQVQTILDQLEQTLTAKVEPPTPKVEPTPTPTPKSEATPTPPMVAPAEQAPTVVAVPEKKPLYKRWYLWVGIGAVVVVGVGVGVGVGLTASRVTYPSVTNPAATLEF